VNRVSESLFFDAMAKAAIFADQLELQLVAVFDGEVNLRRVLALFAGLLGGRFDSFDRVHLFDVTALALDFTEFLAKQISWLASTGTKARRH
jgi:hypothetical protein